VAHIGNLIILARKKIIQYRLSISVFTVISLSFFYLLSASWLRWGDLIIDTARELWVPLQLLKGSVLYKDIFYPFGLLAPYLLSFLYSIFGVSVNCLIGCGMVITSLMLFLLYKISRFFFNEIFSGLVTLTFLFVCAFGFYCYNCIFNFILPYAFASTFCILFITASLYFFIKFIFTERKECLILWSLSLSLAFLSRPEMPIPILTVFIFSGLIFILKSAHKRHYVISLYLISPLIVSAAFYLIILLKNHSYAAFIDSIIGYIKGPSQNMLAIQWLGTNNILPNVFRIVTSFLTHLYIIFLLGISGLLVFPFTIKKRGSILRLAAGFILLCATLVFANRYLAPYPIHQYRCITLILLIGSIYFFIKTVRSVDYKEPLAIFTMFFISLALILRIFFNPNPVNYGFYLLSLGLICYYVFFIKLYKLFLESHLKLNANIFSMLLAIFFALQIIPYWNISHKMYAHRNLMAVTDKGTILYWNNSMGINFWKTVDYLIKNTSEKETAAVFPEGVSINFFSGRETPLRYYIFVPADLAKIGEDNVISDLARLKIDNIVVVTRNAAEYGFPSFGIHYGAKILEWINKNYDLAKQIGPLPNTSNEFGAAIFRKKRELI